MVSDTGWTERNGKSYKTFRSTGSMAEAQQICQEYGAILPEPRNQKDMDYVARMTDDLFFLGMTRDDSQTADWYWQSDLTPVTWYNWLEGGI